MHLDIIYIGDPTGNWRVFHSMMGALHIPGERGLVKVHIVFMLLAHHPLRGKYPNSILEGYIIGKAGCKKDL